MPNTQGLFLFVTRAYQRADNWKKSCSLVSRLSLNILKTLIQLENLEEILQNPKNLDKILKNLKTISRFIYSFIFQLYAPWPLFFEHWIL